MKENELRKQLEAALACLDEGHDGLARSIIGSVLAALPKPAPAPAASQPA